MVRDFVTAWLCRGVIMSWRDYVVAWLCRGVIMSWRDYVVAWLFRCVIMSLRDYVVAWFCYCVIMSMRDYVVAWLRRCVITSLRHFVTAWLCRCVIFAHGRISGTHNSDVWIQKCFRFRAFDKVFLGHQPIKFICEGSRAGEFVRLGPFSHIILKAFSLLYTRCMVFTHQSSPTLKCVSCL